MTRNINTWIHKIEKTMESVQKDFMVSLYQEQIEQEYREHLRVELEDSKYTLDTDTMGDYLRKCNMKYVYELDGIKLTVICIKVVKNLREKIIRSLFRIKTIRELFDLNDGKQINIVLLPINQPRKKPGKGEHIQPKHINGAYTYISDGTIYIYRMEEWPKVVLHEVLHNVPKLQSVRWNENDIAKLYDAFAIDRAGCPQNCKTILEPTEAVIETWAIFLHTVFVALEHGESADFYKLLKEELTWNNQQIRWVLEKQKTDGKGIWYEDTHTFSYIVLRGILLHNLGVFLGMKIPYSGNLLADFFIKKWGMLKRNILKLAHANADKKIHNNTSMRMSKFGDM